MLDTDKEMDDIVYPALYAKDETPDKKIENLTIGITSTEAAIANAIDVRSRIVFPEPEVDLRPPTKPEHCSQPLPIFHTCWPKDPLPSQDPALVLLRPDFGSERQR